MTIAGLNQRAESTYFAQPYSLSATGFYFTSLDDYQAKASALTDDYGMPVEEFEIQYIDGDQASLFAATRVNQATLTQWFELLDDLDGDEDRTIIACHLAEMGYAIDELSSRWDDYSLYRGSAADYAEEFVSECYQIPGNLAYYLDYDRLGRDMALEGSITELEHNLLLIGG
jgi:hypothetical protein